MVAANLSQSQNV